PVSRFFPYTTLFRSLPQLGRDFQRVRAVVDLQVEELLPEVRPEDLREAWQEILRRARLNARHHITREQLSVRELMTLILRRLADVRFMEFTELFMERVEQGEAV